MVNFYRPTFEGAGTGKRVISLGLGERATGYFWAIQERHPEIFYSNRVSKCQRFIILPVYNSEVQLCLGAKPGAGRRWRLT